MIVVGIPNEYLPGNSEPGTISRGVSAILLATIFLIVFARDDFVGYWRYIQDDESD
jgi:hypothetical protein